MDVRELINGIVVIIDDEVNDTDSDIYKIRRNLMDEHIPVAVYEEIPDKEDVKALSHAAFIILDWNYYKESELVDEEGERLIISGLKEEKKAEVMEFLRILLLEIFVPVFIFTTSPPDEVLDSLQQEIAGEGQLLDNRVFVKQKNDVLSGKDKLFQTIDSWLKKMPSVYALKTWEKTANEAKTNMFLEWNQLSPNWVSEIWEMEKEDSIENTYEFGSMITRNIINRMQLFDFDEEYIQSAQEKLDISKDELRRIMEGERYQRYGSEHLPKQAYTGDLIKNEKKYYLNIRAQCDISRIETDGAYNPDLYCIAGEQMREKLIATKDIELKEDGMLLFSNGEKVSLNEINEIYADVDRLSEFNKKFKKNRNNLTFYHRGELLEKKNEAIIACVDGGKIIKFDLKKFCIKPFEEVKDKRIGRILPPYITRIQAKFSQYIVREGVMPLPEKIMS